MKTLTLIFIFLSVLSFGQTTVIQTITYDSTGRDYVFQFPADNGTTYEKIIMEYSMRCKDGKVSTHSAPNDDGCGEWDYSCNTFIVDSTKTDSVKATHKSYDISNFSESDYAYVLQPTFSYTQFQQYAVNYNSTISEIEAVVGTGSESLNYPFSSGKTSKVQYLFTANELTTAGLQSGHITGLKLNINTVGSECNFLKIRIKQTSQTELTDTTPELNDFTEVYFKNTTFETGTNFFKFYNNFTWDGSSNLLVEFSYTNHNQGTATSVTGHNTNKKYALISHSQDNFIEFAGCGRVDITNSDYSSVENEITVQFWAYGNPDILPVNTSAFEARDSDNRRQVHVHFPWSDSKIYWDCGNNGSGFDRIYKTASNNEMAGNWHHWAFTKNTATGKMIIYLNGNLWKQGTGKTKKIKIENFKFGSNIKGNYPYFGYIDDFSVWNKELTQDEIKDNMFRSIDASHPEYSHLINYFKLDNTNGNVISDSSQHHINGLHDGLPIWKTYRGEHIFKNFTVDTYRPNITFVQGEYNLNIDTLTVLDSVENAPNMVIAYDVTGTDLVTIDTNLYYQAGNMFIYDEAGNIVDTVFVSAVDTLHITDLLYYKKSPSIFEIMSFVTPYGLYLDLGQDGKTWQFDVTDFAPVLKGKKRLFLTGGTHQEDLDIKFIFKQGTPSRNVVDIQQIWKAGTQRGYKAIMDDKYFEPRDVKLNSSATMYKIRAAITGHGQEGEFISRTHFININGGDKEFQWNVWKECADNPIYPQGGTWIYDRAGWCPGAPTDLQEFEITDMVTSDDIVNIDYGVASGSGDSRYIINCQLVSYSNPNFTNDVSIVEIQRPSNRVEFSRVNPVCYNPTVVIKNTGSEILTSCKITYGVSGGETKEYDWTGNLKFNEKTIVALPIQEASFWVGDNTYIFNATVSEPNGVTDEYEGNNTLTTDYILPDIYADKLYISLYTNNRANQNSYVIKDVEGNIVFTRENLQNNTYYKDTLDLADGCYTLEMIDTGNDGLKFWANPSQGSGMMRLRSATNNTTIYKTFQTDFGKIFNYSFVIGNITHVNQSDSYTPEIQLYPNPTNGIVNIRVKIDNTDFIEINVYDLAGKKIISEKYDNMFELETSINLSEKKSGIYICKIRTENQVYVRKISLTKQ